MLGVEAAHSIPKTIKQRLGGPPLVVGKEEAVSTPQIDDFRPRVSNIRSTRPLGHRRPRRGRCRCRRGSLPSPAAPFAIVSAIVVVAVIAATAVALVRHVELLLVAFGWGVSPPAPSPGPWTMTKPTGKGEGRSPHLFPRVYGEGRVRFDPPKSTISGAGS